jgi:Transposase IS66 family
MELPEIRPEERTPVVEALLGIIQQLLDHVGQLEVTVQQLRDENARLKGQKPRPDIKPSVLEASKPKTAAGQEGGKRAGSAKRPKTAELTIHHEVPLHPEGLPVGATFKGYEAYVVQELIIHNDNTRYLRARYDLPGGGSVLAAFPEGVLPVAGGHFGAQLIAYMLHQYHHNHVTQPLLLVELWDLGIDISAGQLSRILTEDKEIFHQEKAELLPVALTVSSYIGTDDTGARHQGHNGFCTVIRNDLFTYFESTDSKSRLNFLQVLQGANRTYAINEMTLAYWERQELSAELVRKLSHGIREFADEAAWQARLAELAITGQRHVRIATEGALLGGLIARGVSPNLGVLSDGAQQFFVFVHAACWVHAERPLARMVPHNEEHRTVIEKVRDQLWELYKDLKGYQEHPEASQKSLLEARFDALCDQRTKYPNIDGVLKDMGDHKADLLRVLERPEVPLHNNGAESDIREYVKKRKISGSTRSDEGRRCRDTFASLKKTCRKLGVRFWDYLQDRVRGLGKIPRLADLIRQRTEKQPANGAAVPA